MPHFATRLGKSVRLKPLGASAPRKNALNASRHPGHLLHRIRLAQHQICMEPPVRGVSTRIDRECYQESV